MMGEHEQIGSITDELDSGTTVIPNLPPPLWANEVVRHEPLPQQDHEQQIAEVRSLVQTLEPVASPRVDATTERKPVFEPLTHLVNLTPLERHKDIHNVSVRLSGQRGQLHITLGLNATADIPTQPWTEGLSRLAVVIDANGKEHRCIEGFSIVLDLNKQVLHGFARAPGGLHVLWKNTLLLRITQVTHRETWKVRLVPGRQLSLPERMPQIDLY